MVTTQGAEGDRIEAALWMLAMTGSGHLPGTAAPHASLDAWLEADDKHVHAYAEMTELWRDLGEIAPDFPVPPATSDRRVGFRSLVGAVCAILVLVIGWSAWPDQASRYRTDIGEQRKIALHDGSVVTLNTNSEISVRFAKRERRITLARGEAFFDVARDRDRPFIVEAALTQVEVIGTRFSVRREGQAVDVALVSGKVQVGSGPRGSSPRVMMKPGDRWRGNGDGGVLDRPSLEPIIAWRQGEVILDRMSLADAIGEMNRYSKIPIRLDAPGKANRRISGVFRIGDSESFAQSAAALHRMRLYRRGDSMILAD